MPYPTASEVAEYAVALGIDLGAYADDALPADLDAVTAEFERRTGRPGFQDGQTRTISFDPPDGRDRTLDLWIPDFASIASVVYSPTPRTLTESVDYLTWRENEQATSGPFVKIEFLNYPGSERRCISVTGVRGYGDCPGDVFNAIKGRTLAIYLGAPIDGAPGPILSEKLGQQSVQYDLTAGRDVVSRYTSAFDSVCRRYRRFR